MSRARQLQHSTTTWHLPEYKPTAPTCFTISHGALHYIDKENKTYQRLEARAASWKVRSVERGDCSTKPLVPGPCSTQSYCTHLLYNPTAGSPLSFQTKTHVKGFNFRLKPEEPLGRWHQWSAAIAALSHSYLAQPNLLHPLPSHSDMGTLQSDPQKGWILFSADLKLCQPLISAGLNIGAKCWVQVYRDWKDTHNWASGVEPSVHSSSQCTQ